jgi:hypothetical protein
MLADKADNPIQASFDDLRKWANEANLRSGDNPPDFQHPMVLPEGTRRSIISAKPANRSDRKLVAFRVLTNVETREPRHVLPVHYAIMRALELVPGMLLRMIDKSAGKDRLVDERIYNVMLIIPDGTQRKLKQHGHKTFNKVSIMRVLFAAPPDAELHEIYRSDYHLIVPGNYVLTKLHSKDDVIGQQSVLDAVRKLFKISTNGLNAEEMAALLVDLFKLGQKWHGAELCGHPV